MATALGLLGFSLFIVAVVALAAGITWVVVKLSPPRHGAGSDGSPAPPTGTQNSPGRRSSQTCPRARRQAEAAGKATVPK